MTEDQVFVVNFGASPLTGLQELAMSEFMMNGAEEMIPFYRSNDMACAQRLGINSLQSVVLFQPG